MAHTKIHTYAVNAFKPKNLLDLSICYDGIETVYYVAIPKDSRPEDVWCWETNGVIFRSKVFPTKPYEEMLSYTPETVLGSGRIVEFNKKNVKRAKPNSKEFIKYDAKYKFIRFTFRHSFKALGNIQVMFNKDQQIIKDIMRSDNKSRVRMFHTDIVPSYWDDSDL